MGVLQKVARAMQQKFLREDEIIHSRSVGHSFGPLVLFDLPRSKFDSLIGRVGDGTNSDVLMSTVRWIQRAGVEAPIVALDADDEPDPDGELQALFDRPNDFYTTAHLIGATLFDLAINGNSYWLPAVDGNGDLAELWWVPSSVIEPKWEDAAPGVFIDHYLYHPGSVAEQKIAPEDLLHFRLGVDPRNIRKGLSPMRGLLRELVTDDEAAAFTAALLTNGGVPSLVISPTDADTELSQDEIKAAVAKLETRFTGSGRGKVLGLTGPVKVEQFGFSPQQMDLSVLRDVSEERITAALGIPAAVVGFGAGLQTAKVGATMGELIQMAHNNGVIPLQRIIEDTVNQHLSPSFGEGMHIEFDLTQVQALQEDQDAIANRVERLVRSGIITRKMALTELGFEAKDSDDVYLLQLSTVEVPRNGARSDPEPEEPEGEELTEVDLDELRMLTRGERKTHSLTEQTIIERSPRVRRIPRRIERFASAVDRIRRDFIPGFSARLEPVFERLGEEAERVVLQVLEELGELVEGRSAPGAETKQDDMIVRLVLTALEIAAIQDDLAELFGEAYLEVAGEIIESLAADGGFEFVLTDQAQINILRQGGLRAGLIDLDTQTRDALFDALAEARAEGLAGENLARRIRDRVTAGPWRDAATRARVIARTEGAHAANTATLEAARGQGETEHVLVTDNRTGFNDEDCVAANGRLVTIQEAEAMGLAHPNCSRAFTPVNSLLLEELELETTNQGPRLAEPI